MKFEQRQLTLETKGSTAHLITRDVLLACPFLKDFDQGMLQVFIRHTSASLSINENTDENVRRDLMMALDRIVPETLPYRHAEEGPDDMPSHVKSSLLSASVLIPIRAGQLCLGQWQGIYLCEHRAIGHRRELVCTAWGQ